MTTIFALTLMYLATSFLHSARMQVEISRDEVSNLNAEFMAESGLHYSIRQLQLDPDWGGTPEEGFGLKKGKGFIVQRLDDGADDGAIDLLVSGIHNGSSAVYEANLTVTRYDESFDPALNKALAVFGGDLTMDHSVVRGDILVGDAVSYLQDYDYMLEDWRDTDLAVDPTVTMTEYGLDGTLYTFNGSGEDGMTPMVEGGVLGAGYGGIEGTTEIMTEDLSVPGWNLEDYLTPGPDRLILRDENRLEDLDTTLTVVLELAAGERIDLVNCQLHGGLVVYAEPSYDYRGSYRNLIVLNDSEVGDRNLDAQDAVHPRIGIIAPAAAVKKITGAAVEGFIFVHSVGTVENAEITGALYALNGIGDIVDSVIKMPENLFEDPFPGMLSDFDARVDLTAVWETYPELENIDLPGGHGDSTQYGGLQ